MERTAVLLLLLLVTALAQVQVQWNKTFGGAGAEGALSVQQTSDGGYVIAGTTSSFGAGGGDIWLLKTDASGNLQWDKTFGGAGADVAYSVQQTSDGGYVIAGISSSFGGNQQAWFLKTGASGTMQWNRTLVGEGYGGLTYAQQTSDGGYALAGFTAESSGTGKAWLVKTDSNGNMLWDRKFGAGTVAFSMQQAIDGGYVLGGASQMNSSLWMAKTDAKGNVEWNHTFGGPFYRAVVTSVRQVSDGGYIASGHAYPSNDPKDGSYGLKNAILVKTSAAGELQWIRVLGTAGSDDFAYSVLQTQDKGYLVVGTTTSLGAGSYDFWLVKTDASGNEQWNKTIGGQKADQAYSIQQTSDGGYIVAGSTESYGAGGSDVWLVKLAPEGAPQQPSGTVQCGSDDIICITKAAVEMKDEKVCGRIGNPVLRDSCIIAAAVAKRDPGLCDKLSDASKASAQDYVCKATVSLDIKYCDGLKTAFGAGDQIYKDGCYSIIAASKKDRSICEKIKMDYVREGCISGVANATGTVPKLECTTDTECGDNACYNSKCVEPKLTFLFLPVNWKGTMEEFGRIVDEKIAMFINATPLKDCSGKVKVIKGYGPCEISSINSLLDLAKIKKCASFITTNYDQVVGLTDSVDSFFGIADGISVPGFPVTLITTRSGQKQAVAHEIGHAFGLKDEYCNFQLRGIGKCGFGVAPNPLKSEYGCREEGSPYDGGGPRGCCTSRMYKDACKGNAGASESGLAERIFSAGVYDVIDSIYLNINNIYGKMDQCAASGSTASELRVSLGSLERNISRYLDLKDSIRFDSAGGDKFLTDLNLSAECLGETGLCSCLAKHKGRYMAGNSYSKGEYPLYEFIRFNSRNIMTASSAMEPRRGGSFEFSKPAYDYLSTLPEMQCSEGAAKPPAVPPRNATRVGKPANVTLKNATLPMLYYTACAENSETHKIYCFGGEFPTWNSSVENYSDKIFEYDPAADTVAVKKAKLPSPRVLDSCVEDSNTKMIYCFGGYGPQGGSGTKGFGQIIEYDPASDGIAIKNATTSGIRTAKCAAGNKKVYCFGELPEARSENGVWFSKIIEYGPAADAAVARTIMLPIKTYPASCVGGVGKIYCFGSYLEDRNGQAIFEYDPATGKAELKSAELPEAVQMFSCAANSATNRIYCLGGVKSGDGGNTDKIFEYDPAADAAEPMSATMPSGRMGLSCAEDSASHKAYCFGGIGSGNTGKGILEFAVGG